MQAFTWESLTENSQYCEKISKERSFTPSLVSHLTSHSCSFWWSVMAPRRDYRSGEWNAFTNIYWAYEAPGTMLDITHILLCRLCPKPFTCIYSPKHHNSPGRQVLSYWWGHGSTEGSHSPLVPVAEFEPRLSGFRVFIPNHNNMNSEYKRIAQTLSSDNLSLVGVFPVHSSFKMGAPRFSSPCPNYHLLSTEDGSCWQRR